MTNLRWLLVPAMLAVLSACGGGGSPSATPPVSAAPQSSGPKGTAQVTLRFPANFAIAASAKSTQSKKSAATTRQKPAYINPSIGYTFVVQINGQTIEDPSTGHAYFTIGSTNADGSTNVTVPISSNGSSYSDGALCFQEWDGPSGSGNEVAYGCNEPYTDTNGIYNSGAFTITPGGTTAIVLTMEMNATQIAITTDPDFGSDATTNNAQPFCINPGQNIYAFAADPSNGYVLPGTPAGYGGGDPNNPYPGIPAVTLQSQSIVLYLSNPPNVGNLSALTFGWSFQSDGQNGVAAVFTFNSPLEGGITETFDIAPSGGGICGG